MNRTVEREWQLFVDWCLSRGSDTGEVTADTLTRFFDEVPVAASTRTRRAARIIGVLADAGIDLGTGGAAASTIRTGEGWVGIPQALAQLPTLRYPVGLRGRRDGWLLVLLGVLGFTRNEALRVTESDVVLFGGLAVAGRPVPQAAVAGECPACAVHRWFQVAGPASFGYRSEVIDSLDASGVDVDAHACLTGLDGSWRNAVTLLPSIDQYGWVRDVPLSLIAVSNIMTVRQRRSGYVERASVPRLSPEQRVDVSPAALTDLAAAFDDADARVAELLARTAEILGDASGMMDHLRDFGLEPED